MRNSHRNHHKLRILGIIALLLSVLIVIPALAFKLAEIPETRRAVSVTDEAPPPEELSPEESADAILAVTEVEEEEAMPAQDKSTWKAGWIQYDGHTYERKEKCQTYLVMGIDSDKPAAKSPDSIRGGQADALFLVVMDPQDRTLDMVAINRNTMTAIDVYNAAGEFLGTGRGQICLQHAYGDGMALSCERTVKAVSGLFYDIPIRGYVSVNMGAIPQLNHAVGGVTLEILEDVKIKNGPTAGRTLKKGETVTLNDSEAYAYVRSRDTNIFDSASARLTRQKQYLSAFVKSMKEVLSVSPLKALDIYSAIKPYTVTNISTVQMAYLASQLGNYNLGAGRLYSLKGETTIGITQHEEFNCDEEALYELIIKLFYRRVEDK